MVYYLVLINIYSYLIFYIDKRKAIKKKSRISEAHLLTSAILGGVFGGFISMHIYRHKTRKLKFVILMPVILIVWLYKLYKI